MKLHLRAVCEPRVNAIDVVISVFQASRNGSSPLEIASGLGLSVSV